MPAAGKIWWPAIETDLGLEASAAASADGRAEDAGVDEDPHDSSAAANVSSSASSGPRSAGSRSSRAPGPVELIVGQIGWQQRGPVWGLARGSNARKSCCRKFPTIAGRPAWPNPPSAGAPSTTASSPAGFATAAASPPKRSTASAASWRRNRNAGARPAVIARGARAAAGAAAQRRVQRRRSTAMSPSITPDPPTVPAAAVQRRRSAAQLPLLRQPAEVSAVRQHLLAKSGWSANRVSLELANIHPRPPALRLFDAGVGDGTVLLPRDALDARPLPAHAVLRRRQGDQPRGRAARRCRRCRTASWSIRRPCWC